MRSKIYFRRKMAKAEAGENDDSMTLMDAIRIGKKPTKMQEREQQQTRLEGLVAEGEAEYHEVILDATDFSSGSDEDLGRVVCQFKRKRKCMDLCDILKRDPPVLGRAEGENSQSRKAKNLEPIRKGHAVSADRNGRRKITAKSRPPASTVPNSKAVQRHILHCASSPVGHQADDLTEMDTMKSFSDSVGFSKPIAVTDGPALHVETRQRFRAAVAALRRPASPISRAGREFRSSSQPNKLQKSSEADLLPVSASSLHTCADAKNCQNACVAKAVAPHLDHMSEEELIYWYEEVTKNKFTQRNGEKVRGRIRRVIRAEVKGAPTLNKSSDGRNKSACDEVQKSNSSALEPSTPSPGKLVIDIPLQESPRARESPASIGSKENISCAFNSAASFDDDVGEERARTSPNRSEGLVGTAAPFKDELELSDSRLCTEEGLALECEPLEIALVIIEPESAEENSVPIDIALDVNHGPEALVKQESVYSDPPSPSSEKRKLTGDRCGDTVNHSQSDSPEGQSLLPSVESESEGPSITIVASHPLNVQLKVSEGFEPVLNVCRIAESETISHQPSVDSTRESMDCALNSDAAELSRPVADKAVVLPLIQQECGIVEDLSVRSVEEKSPKTGPGSSPSLIATERALFSPNLISSPPREQWSADSQYGTSLQSCETGATTRLTHSDNSTEKNPPDDLALEVAGGLKPHCDDCITPIQGNSISASSATKGDENREESMATSSQGEILSDELFYFQETAQSQDLHDQITEPAEGISIELETSQRVVDSTLTSESQQSVDRLNQLVLVDTSDRSRDVEVPVQGEPQLPCVVEEQNTAGKLAEVCEISLEDVSQQPGSPPARSDSSPSGDNEPRKGIDGRAETCRTATEVDGVDGKVSPTCHGPLLRIDSPGDETEVSVAENVPSLQSSQDGSEKEDRVLSLEEYVAVHRGEDAASREELEEDVTTQGMDEDVASELMESRIVSGEYLGHGSKDQLVDEIAIQQMQLSVACCQKLDTSDDHVERISSLKGDPDEGVAVPQLKDMGISQEISEGAKNNFSEEISTKQSASDITSDRLQGEVPFEFRDESGLQNQAEAEAAPTETDIFTSQDLEGDGTVEAKEKEVLSGRNPDDGNTICSDGGAVSPEYVEEEVTARKIVTRANQLDVDPCGEDVSLPDQQEDAGCKAMEDETGKSQKTVSDGTAIEVDGVLATQEIVEIVVASEQLPQEVLGRSNIEEDTTLQHSQKNQCAPCFDKLGSSQRAHDGTTEKLTEQSCSLQLDNDITQGGNDLPCSVEGGVENQANLNVAPSQVAGVDVPHFEEDIATRRKEESDSDLQSMEENVAPDQIAEISEFSFPGPGPTQSMSTLDVVSLDQMDSTGVSTFQLGEDGVSEHVEDVVELHPAQGVVQSREDHISSPHHVNDIAEASNFCEKAGEDSLEYPVALSQPRRSETDDDGIQESMSDAQRTTQITTPVSRRITRASLKLEKSILVGVEKLADSFKLSSPQSPGANSVLPNYSFTCASDWDPESVERSKPSVLASAEKSHPPTARLSLVSEAEIEQIDNFEYAMLQEEEWQNAGKFSNHIDMSFFEEDVAVSSPRKRKFNDLENDSDRGKRVAVEAPLQEVAFGSVQDNASERVTEENSMDDDHVPTALSKAKIERNGERSGAHYGFPSLVDQESPLTEQHPNAKQKPERVAREKRKLLLERSPESNCNSAITAESNGCIDLLACEKLGEEESSQDFETPSKLLCRRKTISPLSQLELMRASNSNSPPSDASQIQKIPAFRLKLDSHHGGPSPFERELEPTPGCIYLEPSNKTGKDEANNGCVVSLDSSEDETDDSYNRQELDSRSSGGEAPRKFSLCLSPTSHSPESVRIDSSPNVSSQEPRDSQFIGPPSSKGILKPPQACKGPCKCATCSTSRFTAGNAAGFVTSQMKTFQLIAGSLTKEMQGLRTIIETNLSSPGETSKIPETLKKCKDVEEAAQKNLATLRRDCKRYCKLAVMKPIRKISFADEAGKKLCHVKTFQSQSLL